MTNIKRITANLATDDVTGLRGFYVELFNMDVVMDIGWITTLQGQSQTPVQLSIAYEGGSGTQVPDLSIEVDDIDAVHSKAQDMKCEIVYPLTDEPWGVRRFYLVDPIGRVLNILVHL